MGCATGGDRAGHGRLAAGGDGARHRQNRERWGGTRRKPFALIWEAFEESEDDKFETARECPEVARDDEEVVEYPDGFL